MKLVAYIAGIDYLDEGKFREHIDIEEDEYAKDPDKAVKDLKERLIQKYGEFWHPKTKEAMYSKTVVDTEFQAKKDRILFARRLVEKFPLRFDEIEKAYPEIQEYEKGWTERQLRWFSDRIDEESNKKLVDEFYRKFGVRKTVPSVRDMKLRMRGTKPYSKRDRMGLE